MPSRSFSRSSPISTCSATPRRIRNVMARCGASRWKSTAIPASARGGVPDARGAGLMNATSRQRWRCLRLRRAGSMAGCRPGGASSGQPAVPSGVDRRAHRRHRRGRAGPSRAGPPGAGLQGLHRRRVAARGDRRMDIARRRPAAPERSQPERLQLERAGNRRTVDRARASTRRTSASAAAGRSGTIDRFLDRLSSSDRSPSSGSAAARSRFHLRPTATGSSRRSPA